MKHKIIIDTDPGIDDAMAIHMAFADLRLAEMAHYRTIVAPGELVPMIRAPEPPADFVHGAEGFGTIPAATPAGGADSR